MKILIIDDDISFIRPVQISLEEAGFEVITAPNGEAGRDLAQKIKPNLIILDIMMPGEHGLSALDQIKETEELKEIPIIVSTNLEKSLPIVRGKADAFVLKSDTSLSQLVETVKNLTKEPMKNYF